MGKPFPDSFYPISLIDHEGRDVSDGQEGEISIKASPHPPGLFHGYLGRDSSKVFANGVYRTGDRAIRDADGYFWFVGRSDDVIKTSDYRVGPFEVESCLIEHPAVLESAVVGRPDTNRGQIVKGFVTLRNGYTPSESLAEDLFRYTRQNLAPMKCPRVIEFVVDLPKTASGKIRRIELRESEEKRFSENDGVTLPKEHEYFHLPKHPGPAKM